MRPKIAPEAPTVTANAELNQSAPAESGEPGDEVDEEESRRAECLLDDRAEPVERQHVEQQVEDAAVEEHRTHESPPVAVRDRRTLQSPLAEELPAGKVDPTALSRRDDVDERR